jgi:hypothetical protein
MFVPSPPAPLPALERRQVGGPIAGRGGATSTRHFTRHECRAYDRFNRKRLSLQRERATTPGVTERVPQACNLNARFRSWGVPHVNATRL